MKSGTGDDPFADDASDSEATPNTNADGADDGERSDAASDAPTDAGSASGSESDPSDDGDTEASDADGASEAPETSDGDGANGSPEANDDAPDIPWVLRRSSVKADRPNVTQFFLRDETDRAERRFQSDVEDILDADVYTLDLREAAYLVAMRHPDEVAAELRDWGYEYLE